MLRRRTSTASGGGAGSAFKPFVLPLKNKVTNTLDEEEEDLSVHACAKENRQALRSGASLTVKRLPFLSFLRVPQIKEKNEQRLKQPFKSPCLSGRTTESDRLLQRKTLGIRRRWSTDLIKPLVKHDMPQGILEEEEEVPKEEEVVVEEIEVEPVVPTEPQENVPPLVLWTSKENPEKKVIVPQIVGKFLRPHQREGVQFMFDCVSGVRGFNGSGCILADDMGLGKTLQSITLMYTLLSTGMEMEPTIKRAIVVCPTSLVKNWDDEIIKWLHGKVKTIALYEASKDAVIYGISQFIEGSKRPRPNSAQVLIISYETYRMHAQRFIAEPSCCELLICDEAHRLKNSNSQINRALSDLACRCRVLLSGTPMQNDLEEFYAMVDFTNPNILGDPKQFRKEYLSPILAGREPDATDSEREHAQACSAMLCEIVNQFILRRGNILNAKHLPPKLMQIVCCPLSQLQEKLYSHFLKSKAFNNLMQKQNANVLSSITALKKLCNHPSLLFNDQGVTNTKLPGFEKCEKFFEDLAPNCNSRMSKRTCHPEWSGKMMLLDRLMLSMKKDTDDRIVIVSNYTQTLDVVSALCQERSLPYVRLDGTTSASKRKKLVDTFNDPKSNSFAFLLSSKAGGCGLNLIGANRLVLFDPDWNPATDKQAAARVWREGQKKKCFVYRFVTTGTLEEKIFQRQLSKEGLQSIVDDKEEVNSLSSKDLKRLFVFKKTTVSDTHDQLKCERCHWRDDESKEQDKENLQQNQLQEEDQDKDPERELLERHYHPQIGMPPEEDLNNWGHHRSYNSVDDEVMQRAVKGTDLVSFAFSCRIDWELLQEYTAQNAEKENLERKMRQEQLERIKRKREEIEAQQRKKVSRSMSKKKRKTVDSADSDFTASSSSSEEEFDFDFDRKPKTTVNDRSPITVFSSDQNEPGSPRNSEPILLSEDEDNDRIDAMNVRIAEPKTGKSPYMSNLVVLDESCESESENDDFDFEKVPTPKTTVKQVTSTPQESCPAAETSSTTSPVISPTPIPRLALKENWNCSRCTLENLQSLDICEGCGLRFRRSRLQTPVLDWDD